MTVRRLTHAAAAAGVLTALLAVLAGCAARPATEPARARVTVAVHMVVHTCPDAGPRQVPMRAAVLLDGRGRRLRVDTGERGSANVRLTPGRYTIAPIQPALRHAVFSARFDGSAVSARRGRSVVDVTDGRHRILLLVALRPLECNGLAATG
jgi:hypothetical protein